MQFKVPQDVQREDTIVGPLTLRQLVICFIGGGLTYGIYVYLARDYTWPVWILPVLIGATITILFAFIKIHDLTFMRYTLAMGVYNLLPRKRIWVKGSAETMMPFEPPKKKEVLAETQTSKNEQVKKMDALVKILDAKGIAAKPE